MIYLDAAATTKLNATAAHEMFELSQNFFGNPSSPYKLGVEAKKFLESSREGIAQICGANSNQIYFTSGASEGNSWALESLAQHCAAAGKNHIISTAVEHHSILNKLKSLEKRGFEVTLIKPPFMENFKNAIKESTGFASVMTVNNETGEILPQQVISKTCRDNGILFHTDATQSIPHFKPNLENVDILTCSAHKFNGPRGVGFLYCNNKKLLTPLIFGGKQESYLRGGTENLPAIYGMKIALKQRQEQIKRRENEIKDITLFAMNSLREIPNLEIHGNLLATIPIINFYVEGLDAEVLMTLLNKKEIYVSSTSACASGEHSPSHVLLAMGYDSNVASNSIRLSFDYDMKFEDLKYALDEIKKSIQFLVKS